MKRLTFLFLVLVAVPLIAVFAAPISSLKSYNYGNSCQHCHGIGGRGKGAAAKLLPIKTPDWAWDKPAYFSDPGKILAKLKALKKDKLKKKNKFYHFTAGLSKNNLYALAVYIKKHKDLAESKRPPIYSKDYDRACGYCHGYSGNGKGILTGFTKKPKDFRHKSIQGQSTDDLHKTLIKSTRKIIRMRKDIPHFPKKITDGQLKAIQAHMTKKYSKL